MRVCAEDRTGYAYSDEVTVDRMRLAAETARVIADQSHKPGAVQVGTRTAGHHLYAIQTSPTQIPVREKVRLLEQIDNAARAVDPRIRP